MSQFPTKPDEIDTAFLTDVLGKAVVSCSSKAIGAGLVGDSARITITYSDGVSGPDTIAGKFPAEDATSRGTAVALQLYEKEVGFYRHIAPKIATRTPDVFFAQHDGATGDFLLLMEDCGPAKQGDQLAGCSLDQARTAVCDLAALHGPTFNNDKILGLPFLRPNPQARAFGAAGYPGASEAFAAFYEGKIDSDLLNYIASLAGFTPQLFESTPPTGPCVIHGDFRLDNMLFSICGGSEPMATLDWQTIALGDPLIDLGYFMGAGIGSALRIGNEAALLELYRTELIAQGGPDLAHIRSASGYARGALQGITTAVFSAAFVEHTERSEAVFQSMAMGAGQLASELDAMQFLEN